MCSLDTLGGGRICWDSARSAQHSKLLLFQDLSRIQNGCGWLVRARQGLRDFLVFCSLKKRGREGKMYVRICSSFTSLSFVLSHGHSVHASVILFWNLVRGVNTRDLRGD